MATVKGKCSACGAAIEVGAAGAFSGAELAASLCPACIDAQFLASGGIVLTLRRDLDGARFPLGKITITPGAVAALAESAQHVVSFLVRHVRGDWGEHGHCDRIELTEDERRRGWEATDDPGKINTSNLLNARDRLMSEYATARGRRLWVVTDLRQGGGTTVLLPEEY
jgi:hypothetical protein